VSKTETVKKPGLIDYFKHVRLEMKKVVWPTRKELVAYTGVVVLVCFVLGLAIWLFDTGITSAFKAVFKF
jgi:preprotein translocase subunit SecE